MVEEWYINAGGRVEGPLSADELRGRAARGDLAPTASVSTDRVNWGPASDVPDITFPAKPRRPLLETVVSGSVSALSSGRRSAPAPPEVKVEGYEIEKTLGVGACGVVYQARQAKLDRVVALKTVLIPDQAPEELLARFKQEALSLAKLQHPNIVAVYDSGECLTPPGQAYFAMELLDGEDFGARLDRDGPFTDETVVWTIARQAAAALAHAAKHGVIHRDVKPANLFLAPVPTGVPIPAGIPFVKVTDFGLALNRQATDVRQTSFGEVVGTPVYMAPEQFETSDVDVRADIYGLGATVYHALAGRPPFDGRSMWEVGMIKKEGVAPRLAPPVSTETADLVAAMLATKPADRPQTYDDLIKRIDKLSMMAPDVCSVPLPRPSEPVLRMPEPAPLGPLPEPPPAPPCPPCEPCPDPEPVAVCARTRWTRALIGGALLGAVVASAIAFFAQSPSETSDKGAAKLDPKDKLPVPPLPPAPGARSKSQHLYDSRSIAGWMPGPDDGTRSVESDAEGTLALTIGGQAVRKFDPPERFRVSLNIDPFEATSVEMVVATGEAPGAIRWLFQIDHRLKTSTRVAFGKRVGANAFEMEGVAVTIETKPDNVSKRPYLELSYTRTDGRITAMLSDQEIGRTPTDAGLKTTELRIDARGGRARIETADLFDLNFLPPKK